MKINKLMLAMAVAASAFAACNKQETTPVVENQPINKSIVLNLANVMPSTKGTGTTIADETQITLNNYQVFFADAEGNFHTPKDKTAAADAETFFSFTAVTPDQDPDVVKQFHFLPQSVTKVVVVGNVSDTKLTAKTYDELMTAVQELAIENQQDPTKLVLYGMDASLTAMTGTYDHETEGEDVHPEPLFKAEINLSPAVARFEVTGFEYAKKDETTDRLFEKITVENLSVINWYKKAVVSLGDDAITIDVSAVDNGDPFFGGFYNDDTMYPVYLTKVTRSGWNFDVIDGVTLTEANPLSGVNPQAENYEDGVACYAYHVFPGASPRFIAELTGENVVGKTEEKPGTPVTTKMYLQTTNDFNPAAGNIYRMLFKFDDSALRAAEKCIQVEITVAKWNVEIVTPTFGKNETTETPETPAE